MGNLLLIGIVLVLLAIAFLFALFVNVIQACDEVNQQIWNTNFAIHSYVDQAISDRLKEIEKNGASGGSR